MGKSYKNDVIDISKMLHNSWELAMNIKYLSMTVTEREYYMRIIRNLINADFNARELRKIVEGEDK